MKRLSLGEITGIAEIIGSIAIVVSLVFVGLQIRQNTKQAEAQTLQTTLSYIASLNDLAQAPESAGLLFKGLNDFGALSPIEKIQFDGMLGGVLSRFIPLVQLYQQGQLPEQSFESMKFSLATIFRSPGTMEWWATAKDRYGPFVQAMVADLMKQYADVTPLSEDYKFGDETK